MASVTALELVNRVRLFRRQPTTTAISTPEDQVTLNALNAAIGDIIGTRRWEFDLRHDGQLRLKGVNYETGAGAWNFTGSADASVVQLTHASLPTTDDISGDFVVRTIFTEMANFSDTAFRVSHHDIVTAGVATNFYYDVEIPVAQTSELGKLVYGEYMLPDTVGDVVRVTYEENPLTLTQVSPMARYEELFPRPHWDEGPPELVAVGGFDTATYDSSTGDPPPEPKLRLAVYPIPDEDYILNYSYYYIHPELTVATDTLQGVPPNVVNDIVMQATSIVKMAWDSDYAGAHFSDLAQSQATAKHQRHGGSNARRHTIHSGGSYSDQGGGPRIPVQRGFPNKVIG